MLLETKQGQSPTDTHRTSLLYELNFVLSRRKALMIFSHLLSSSTAFNSVVNKQTSLSSGTELFVPSVVLYSRLASVFNVSPLFPET